MKQLVIKVIGGYRRISTALIAARFGPLAWSGCRQIPTCSEYCEHQVAEHGAIRGLWRGFIRFLRCNPVFSPAW